MTLFFHEDRVLPQGAGKTEVFPLGGRGACRQDARRLRHVGDVEGRRRIHEEETFEAGRIVQLVGGGKDDLAFVIEGRGGARAAAVPARAGAR